MLRTIPVRADDLGLVSAGQPEALMKWTERDGRRVMSDEQERDEQTGELLWTAFVVPSVGERPEVLQVRVRAAQQPVLGMFSPVHVDGLEVNVRTDKAGRVTGYWSASGIRDGGNGHRPKPQEHKGEGQ